MILQASATYPQFAAIVLFLRECIMERTKIPEAELGNDMNLSDLGVTSLDAVLISGQIEEHYNCEIDPAIMFHHRTVHAIAEHLLGIVPTA